MTTATAVEQKVFTLLGPQREIYWDDRRYLFYKSGRGCVAAGTLIYDPIAKTHTAVEDLASKGDPIHVLSLTTDGETRPMPATAPFVAGVAPLYEVTLADARAVIVSAEHQFLTADRSWRPLSQISLGERVACSPAPPPSKMASALSASRRGVQRWKKTDGGFLPGCSPYPRHDGQPLHAEVDTVPVFSPSQDGARGRIPAYCDTDGRWLSLGHSRAYRPAVLPAKSNSSPSGLSLADAGYRDGSSALAPFPPSRPLQQRSLAYSFPQQRDGAATPHQMESLDADDSLSGRSTLAASGNYNWQRIVSIAACGSAPYYDLQVPDTNNYLAHGIWHHNCGKTVSACMRIGGMIARGEILPGARILVTGPSYPQLKKGTLMSFDKWMGPEGLDLIQGKIDGNEPERRLPYGIVAYFRNASNPDQFRSHEIQIAWHDEAAQDDAELIPLTNANLRQFGDDALYQTILTSTPRGKRWLYNMFINPETRLSEEMAGVYHITTVEAEALGIARPGYVEEMGYVPGTAMYDQEVLGLEVAWTGNVFHYQPERDTPAPFILPTFKAVYGGIDIGTTAPTAVVLVGIDERGGYWVFREYYQKRANFHEVLKLIGEWHKEFKVKRWSIDAAANLEMRMMRSAGFPVTNSLKAKDAAGTAVNFINSLMERDMFRVSPDCPALIMELETYEHKEIMSGDEVTFLDKVKPNQPDHALDALRYCVAPLSSAGAQQQYGREIGFSIGARGNAA